MSQPPPPGPPSGDKKDAQKKKRISSHKSRGPNKIRVKLPTLEAFQKEVVFKLEGPGRVVVRLERLMGSDRVRLTDNKFMIGLLERLEEEEHDAWLKRTKLRKKNERNRSRHLAIEGLMEPGDDMKDLHKHPVFRVNRVLKRLAKFDESMSQGQDINLHPIVLTEPFETNDSGKIFKTYPGHARFVPKNGMTASEALVAEGEEEQHEVEPSVKILVEQVEEEDDDDTTEPQEEGAAAELTDDYPEEWDGEGAPPSLGLPKIKIGVSLTEIQESYGINQDEDLTAAWEPFRSQLVELIYSGDTEKMAELFTTAKEVHGVYTRESLAADNFVKKIQRYLGVD